MQLQIYSTQGRSQREAGWAKTLPRNALASLEMVQQVSQWGQSSPYICYIFLLTLVEKTKDFYCTFHIFILPDNGENQIKEGLHRKFNTFSRVIFLFG